MLVGFYAAEQPLLLYILPVVLGNRSLCVADSARIARSPTDRQVDPATGELLHVLEHEVRCVSHPSYPVGRYVSVKK